MGRPKQSAPKHVEPEQEPQVAEEATGKTITKAEAVRQALAAGNELPEDGVGYIKRIHGIDMPRQIFSSYKTQEKARQAKQGTQAVAPKDKPGRNPKEGQGQAIEGYLAPPAKPPATGETDLLVAMEAMKPLVASLGADKVKRIVDLLG
jgi:hypothetical protein